MAVRKLLALLVGYQQNAPPGAQELDPHAPLPDQEAWHRAQHWIRSQEQDACVAAPQSRAYCATFEANQTAKSLGRQESSWEASEQPISALPQDHVVGPRT